MRLLLDTCTILWAVLSPQDLSAKAKECLLDEDSLISVSPISCAEIACACEQGRIRLEQHWKIWFRRFIEQNGWQVTAIDLPIIEEAYSLPGPFHADLADRILAATARLERAFLVTADTKLLHYPHVETIW